MSFLGGEQIVKLSRAGLVCCGFFALWFALLVGRSYFVDTKTAWFLTQLAVAPAVFLVSALMALLGVSKFPVESPFNNLYVFGVINLVLSYVFGWTLGAIGRALVRLDGGRLNRLDERLLDRIDKDS
jgi:hypothetical protein